MSRILPSLGASKFIHEIDDAVIAAHVAKRRGDVNRNHKTKTPLSPRRINADVELLRRIWKRAEKTWKVNVGSPPDWSGHLLPVENERQRELSEEEETRLFKALRPDFHALVYAAMRLGVRVSGLRGLTWSDVDLKAQTLTVTLKGSRGAPGRRSRKPIPSDVLQVIANEKSHHPIFVFTYECMKSRGERKRGDRYPFSLNGWRKAWTDALAKAEIEDFRFHDLRHTAASRLLRVTQNLRLTQVALDHRTIQTTTRYAHILDDDLRDGLELAKSRKIPEAVAEADPNALPEKKKRA
jgi:integrase